MPASASNYAKLIELAKEGSSETRRSLLRDVTDLFFVESNRSSTEIDMFGEVLSKVAFELDTEVRAELARRFAPAANTPRQLAVKLAHDDISVAAPILRRSSVLTDDDLVSVVEKRGHEYQMAVTQRPVVSERVSEALVNHGNDTVVGSLLENTGARFSRDTFEVITDRALTNPDLHRPIVHRMDIPADLLNELYLVVEGPLRAEIMERNATMTPAEVEDAMSKARTRVAVSVGALPDDYLDADRWVQISIKTKKLSPSVLAGLCRDRETTKFHLAFAATTGLDYETTRRLFQSGDMDGLAIACRASNLDRALFVTLVALGCGDGSKMTEAENLGRLYNDVTVEAAQRAMRFWKLRMQAEQGAGREAA